MGNADAGWSRNNDSDSCAAWSLSYRRTAPDPMVTASNASPEAPPELPVVRVVPSDPPSADQASGSANLTDLS